MTLTVEAIYEDGVLKLSAPLPLAEHEKVQVTVQSMTSVAQETAGLLKWQGDTALLERVACDPEFSVLESP
jgi:predicted DNA-binding antitoxin AbrB/MazE fold protein